LVGVWRWQRVGGTPFGEGAVVGSPAEWVNSHMGRLSGVGWRSAGLCD
jgi:hypothetical protein